jgi:4-hydroxy-tetrahydrodipicolinate synthase
MRREMSKESRFGLSAALATPFTAEGAIDYGRLAEHASWCLGHGCDSVTAFGTTGEGASVSLAERERVLGALAASGIEGGGLVVGVSASSVDDAVEQARIGLAFSCRALLLAPPFYFKNAPEDGTFAWFASVFERLGGAARGVFLYNIPSMTAVAMPVALIRRLRDAFRGVVSGVKDSSSDWTYTQALLANRGDLSILIGDERHLAAGVRHGAEGSICGVAYILPGVVRRLAVDGTDDPRVTRLVDAMARHPIIPALKALIAERTGDAAWLRVRPPLVPADASALASLREEFEASFTAEAA